MDSRFSTIRIIVRPSAILTGCGVSSIGDGLIPAYVDPSPIAHNVTALKMCQLKSVKRVVDASYSTERIRHGIHGPLRIGSQGPFFGAIVNINGVFKRDTRSSPDAHAGCPLILAGLFSTLSTMNTFFSVPRNSFGSE